VAQAASRRIPEGEGTEGEEIEKKGDRRMKKWMVLFFILLICVPTLTHAQSEKDAVLALKKLQAKIQEGISYMDYRNALGEAKFPLNIFLESKDAQKYPELSISLKKVMGHYEYAGFIWDGKISGGVLGSYIGVNSDVGKEIGQLYPNARKDTKEGGALTDLPTLNAYDIDSLLPLIWKEASMELDNATKLHENLEEKSSEETATLKKEIGELKKEVARLKEENDRLKNPQKVKKGN